MKGFFDIQEYRSSRHIIVEIEGHLVPSPHTLTDTETKLAFIKQASFFNVPLDSFQLTF
jgi:hypothetical protein